MEQLQDTDLKKSLSSIKEKITAEDKMRVALDLGCSLATVDRYLKGTIGKTGFAKVLLNQLKQLNQTAA